MDDREREIRALEAIIVSQLLRERDPLNLSDLPELTDSQRSAFSNLSTQLVDRLWDQIDDEGEEQQPEADACEIEDEEFAAMNRADEMSEETRAALDEARKEVLDSMRKRRASDGERG